jgi:hypothetical protein
VREEDTIGTRYDIILNLKLWSRRLELTEMEREMSHILSREHSHWSVKKTQYINWLLTRVGIWSWWVLGQTCELSVCEKLRMTVTVDVRRPPSATKIILKRSRLYEQKY